MPRRVMRKGRKGYKKRFNRYRRKQHTTVVNRGIGPVPARFITKQKYSEAFNLTSINPNVVMNLNSVYDPNRSGIGHQPMGYDQMALLYNRYRVISCNFVINGYCATDPVRIAAIPTNDLGITFSGVSHMIESPRCRFIAQYSQAEPKYLKGKVYMPALAGRTKAQYMADDRYQSDVTTSPAELMLLNISAATLVDSYPNATTLTVTLEYVVEYFDVKQLNQS